MQSLKKQKISITIRIDRNVYAAIKSIAEKRTKAEMFEITPNNIIAKAINKYIEDKNGRQI